ncbi:helix-turn-helix domain-containing protein [Yersinia massiliensis]|uniref:helix-turn-helix domain-containing protein n=1 Tax=Yersinia massiliensis TaxID=419257 RepID=UPI0003022A89|nr:helix-turn-helix transcriptional regulator [Yersinia massiliensis]
MKNLTLLSAFDVQQQLADAVRKKRKQRKWSRQALAERSTVPTTTIKKFETTSQISLRQFILLWQCVDSLEGLATLTHAEKRSPRTIDEVLNS